jgi:hypothetical protein
MVALAAVTGTRGGPRTYAISLQRGLVGLATGDEYVLVSEESATAPELTGVRRIQVPVPAARATREVRLQAMESSR